MTNLGRTALEWLSGPDPAGPRVTFSGGSLERLVSAHGQGEGVIFVTGHLGNWEQMGAAVSARVSGQLAVLYKPSYDPRLTRLMISARSSAGVAGVDVSRMGHLTAALRALRAGSVLGILQDQPVDGGPGVPFLDHPAPSSTLAARLARRHGIPLLLGTIIRGPGGRHEITIQQVPGIASATSSQAATRRIHQGLEAVIRCHPCHWLWTLDRWRMDKKGSELVKF